MVANKKYKTVAEKEMNLPKGVTILGDGKEIEVNENQYRKIWKAYVNDPTKSMREMMMAGDEENKVTIKMTSADGKEMTDPNTILRDMEKRTKESLKKNNNPIEPELYGK
jgi:hypothetical protein